VYFTSSWAFQKIPWRKKLVKRTYPLNTFDVMMEWLIETIFYMHIKGKNDGKLKNFMTYVMSIFGRLICEVHYHFLRSSNKEYFCDVIFQIFIIFL
jgi:hypothetical protein